MGTLALLLATAPQALAPDRAQAAASSSTVSPARPITAKAINGRRIVKHQKQARSNAAAEAMPSIAQVATTSSAAPVVGGTWSEIGPKPVASVSTPEGEVAGRITALAVDPSNSATVYAGSADGGVWKTTNGTSAAPSWTPLFDTQVTLAIGAVAVDPNHPNTVYVGTGEPDDCQDCLPSQGVFKSTDGGATWSLLAGSPVHRTTAIVVDRSNSNTVLVATTRGLWRSTDAGASWTQITQIATVTAPTSSSVTPSGGIDALVQDPVNAGVFWAAMGDWCDTEGGSINRSMDSGVTWAESTHFPTLPNATRLALALGKDSNNHVVAYAALAACKGGNYADGQLLAIGKNPDADGTGTWNVIPPSSALPDFFAEPPPDTSYQGWYDITAAVDPGDPTANTAIFGGVTLLLTKDGGSTFTDIANPYAQIAGKPTLLHPDFHTAVFTAANTFYTGNDGGVWYTTNLGTAYTDLNHTLGITQLYAGSSLSGSYLIGGSQDNGTVGLVPGGPASPTWKQLLDGDGGWTAIDPTSGSKVVWAEQTHLDMFKGTYDTASSTWQEIGPCGTTGCPATDNTDFIAPFLMDAKSPATLYAASNFAYRTTDSGAHWQKSPDLTYAASTQPGDEIHTMAQTSGATSTALLTGSKYGRVFITTSANSTTNWGSASGWTEITGNLPAYSSAASTGNSWISGLAVNPTDPTEAWATVSVGSGARVFHTTNAGAAANATSWSDITGAGPTAVPSVVVDSIAVDPQHPQTIFIGTDAGAMVCGTCGGPLAVGSWAPLGTGLPNARVDAITMTSDDATVVAWTHGRDVWTLSNAPRVVLNPTSLNFGNQPVTTTSASQPITLTDRGTTPVVVTAVSVSGDYAQTNNCTTVLPGSSCTINVSFAPAATGTRNGTLSVTDNAADSPQTASLTGNGTPAPTPFGTLTPNPIPFGNQEVGTSSASRTATLTNSGSMNMLITGISISANTDFGESDSCPRSPTPLAAGASCPINVTFSPKTPGSQSATLSVNDNASNSPQTTQLSGTGVQAGAILSPTSLGFGGQRVGSTSAGQNVTLTNTGNEALSISSIGTTGDFAQTNNCGASLAAGAHCTITVTFTPTAPGGRSGTLVVSDSAPTSPQTAALSGTGTQPQASLSPNSLSFGNQAVGDTSPGQNVTLTNNGNEALSVSGIATTGDFAQSNNCDSQVIAGGSCIITVTFTPTATGTRSGTLKVTDDAPGSPQSIPLDGYGYAPGWQSLGGYLTSGPGTASWASNRLDAFVRGSDNALYHKSWDGSTWSDWEYLGGSLSSDPAAVSWGVGRIDVFVRGPDMALWHTSWHDGAWHGWDSLGGYLTSGPAVASWTAGRLDVFVRGPNDWLWHKSWHDGAWSDWDSLGGSLTSDPAAVSWSTDRIDVFVRGPDNALWHKSWHDGAWSGWDSLGGTLTSRAGASSWGAGRLDVFARGPDGQCWHNTYSNGAWSGWQPIGGSLTSGPSAVSRTAGIIDVFVRGPDFALWQKTIAG